MNGPVGKGKREGGRRQAAGETGDLGGHRAIEQVVGRRRVVRFWRCH
jgi:hypothetical protein